MCSTKNEKIVYREKKSSEKLSKTSLSYHLGVHTNYSYLVEHVKTTYVKWQYKHYEIPLTHNVSVTQHANLCYMSSEKMYYTKHVFLLSVIEAMV